MIIGVAPLPSVTSPLVAEASEVATCPPAVAGPAESFKVRLIEAARTVGAEPIHVVHAR